MKPDSDVAGTVDERPGSKPRASEEPLAPPLGRARYEAGEEIARGGIARLEHPSIVPVHDAGTRPDGSPFYVMRKVTGRGSHTHIAVV